MTSRQCRLVTIAKQEPGAVPHGSREHNPRQIALAAVNKGKKYPYNSTTKAHRRNLKIDARMNEVLRDAGIKEAAE